MCLHSVDFNLSYSEEDGCDIGIGYKLITVMDKNGRLNASVIKSNQLKKSIKLDNGWYEAFGQYYESQDNDNRIRSDDYKSTYWPGFHIFLEKDDALCYPHLRPSDSLVKVKFSDVTAFGKNEIVRDGRRTHAQCVIARYIKIIEAVAIYV